MRRFFLRKRSRESITASIEKMRQAAIKACSPIGQPSSDIKCGVGGIRDVEFLVQGLQLIHAPDHPELLGGNTLAVLEALKQVGVLPEDVVGELRDNYIYLRQVEHYLQILEDRQIHALPSKSKELAALAKRVLGPDGDPEHFSEDMDRRREKIRKKYVAFLLEAH
jgi:glutamate-ammonia-ligase adenylyltransferase